MRDINFVLFDINIDIVLLNMLVKRFFLVVYKLVMYKFVREWLYDIYLNIFVFFICFYLIFRDLFIFFYEI